MENTTTQGTIAATMVQPSANHREKDLYEAQLANSVLGPVLQNKEKGEKPSMEPTNPQDYATLGPASSPGWYAVLSI